MCFLFDVGASRKKLSPAQLRAHVDELIDADRREDVVELVLRLLDENTRLELLNAKLRKHRFGKKSEKLDPQQLALLFEEMAQCSGENEALERTPELVVDEGAPREETAPARQKRGHRKPLPADLPRKILEIPVPESQRRCTHCGRRLDRIGSEASEVLEFVPAHFEVRRYEREKLACRACEGGGVVTAPAPDKVIEKGLPGPRLLAHVVVSKFQDSLPLYRQREIFKRQGIDLPRATLGRWCGQAAELVEPVAGAIRERVLSAHVLQTDDTHLRVLDRDHPQGIHRGFLWGYLGDRRWAYFDYTPSREQEGPLAFLASREGWLQADAYSGYHSLFEGEGARCREVGCWAHARRRFVDAVEGGDARAVWPLQRIQALYRIERGLRDEAVLPEVRTKVRQEQSLPVLEELFEWLEGRRDRDPPQSPLGDAVGYALNQQSALEVYTEDGHLEIDNTRLERLIRMVAVGRRNYLFAGSDNGARHAALHYTMIATCRLHGIDGQAYLADVYEKIASGWPQRQLAELLPDAWLRAHPDAPRSPFPA